MRLLCMATCNRFVTSLVLFIILGGPGAANRLAAQEPCEQFLDALRNERLFDIAQEYLDAMSNSDLADKGFRDRVPLYKVAVLLDEASLTRDNARLMRQLDQTEQILADFIQGNPSPVLLAEAQEQRARIFLARAGRLLAQADSDRLTIAQKTAKQEEARDYLKRANEAYEEIRQRLRTELEKKLDPQNLNARSERENLRNKYVLVRMQSPGIKENIAESYGKDHPDYVTLLREAAAQYEELYEKYRTRLSGIDGCLGAARCRAKLDEPERALAFLAEVFDLPRGSVQSAKKREAAVVAIDCWNEIKPFPLEEAYQRLRMVIFSMSPEYGRSLPGIKVRLAYAKACHGLVEKIKANGGPADPAARTRMNNLEKETTKVLRSIVRIPGKHRQEAQALLQQMGNAVALNVDEEKGPPTTMAEARQRGKDLQLRVSQLKSQLGGAEDAQTDEIKKQVIKDSETALGYFEQALSMTTDETAADDLSNIRYLQCASYYQMEMFFEATIIGEYLLEKFPNNTGAQPAAGLICKSYWNMYREAGERAPEGTKPDRGFERDRLVELCTHVFKTWPGSRQAEQAGLVMTLLSLAEGDAIAADKYLAEIPEDSPTRSAIVLEVGNRLWQAYVRGKKSGKVPEGELTTTREQARKLLENGVAFLKVESLTAYEARSALALSELYLDSDQVDLAIEQLENATIAPLDLIKNKHATTNESRFRMDTFKTAIRAYLAKLRDGQEALKWVEKSQAVLEALKAEIGDSPKDKQQLSAILLTLAEQLKQQFDQLESNEERKFFADGLESFLAGLGASSNDRDLMLLTGRMSSEIGQGLKDSGLNPQSERFYEQARKVYEALKQSNETDPRIQLEILRGLANSLRGTGDFKRSISQWGDILVDKKNRNFITLQVEASRVYTDWGLAENDTEILIKAIRGGEQRKDADGRQVTTIMGWANLAKAAQRGKKNALVAEAIYNIARCKFRYGKIKQQPKYQQGAMDEIIRFKTQVPDMGGQMWKSRLESLLATMQQEKG